MKEELNSKELGNDTVNVEVSSAEHDKEVQELMNKVSERMEEDRNKAVAERKHNYLIAIKWAGLSFLIYFLSDTFKYLCHKTNMVFLLWLSKGCAIITIAFVIITGLKIFKLIVTYKSENRII